MSPPQHSEPLSASAIGLNGDPELEDVFLSRGCCDAMPDVSCCRSEWVRMAAMSSSVAEGITLGTKEINKKAGPSDGKQKGLPF
jgi:hypothetical protein